MRWIILVFTSLLLFFSCKKIERINPVDGIVGVQTSAVQQLDLSSVQIGSTLQVTEEVPYVTQRGVCWSINPKPTTANDFVAQGSGFGTFQSKISGLAANTTYYFRSFASNEKTTVYGNEVSYTIKAPILRTKTAFDVSYTSAKVGGELVNDGGLIVSEYGIYWGVFPGISSENSKLKATQKDFYLDLTELENGKTYYYRTFVQTNLGIAYGEEMSFNTLGYNTPSLTTKLVTSIGTNTAISGGEITSDGGLAIKEKGVCWSTTSNPTIADNKSMEGAGADSYTSKLIGLEDGVTYYVRAYATNSKGTSYGNEVSFTTSNTNTNTVIKGVVFVNIPTGSFTMGSPSNEVDRSSDEQQHQVTLSAFKMSKNEITFTQYDAFCDATGRTKPDDSGWGRGNRPVIYVTWYDAKAFADWMGCRLPTEAEWEYACMAGTTTPFNSGNNLTTNQANYNGNYPYNGNQTGVYLGKTQSVGSYPSNAWGLNDMHGNVWEWCSDWYDNYGTGSQTNPTGPSSGSYRVNRGGSWYGGAQYCRSSGRGDYDPSGGNSALGFRLVAP